MLLQGAHTYVVRFFEMDSTDGRGLVLLPAEWVTAVLVGIFVCAAFLPGCLRSFLDVELLT